MPTRVLRDYISVVQTAHKDRQKFQVTLVRPIVVSACDCIGRAAESVIQVNLAPMIGAPEKLAFATTSTVPHHNAPLNKRKPSFIGPISNFLPSRKFARCFLRSRFFLLLLPQRRQADPGHLDHLEPYTRDITLRFTLAAETRQEDFVVLVHEIQTSIVGN